MPAGYTNPTPVRNAKFLNFFTISDIHITDEEAPNQLIYLQQFDGPNAGTSEHFNLLPRHDVHNPSPRCRHADGKCFEQTESV